LGLSNSVAWKIVILNQNRPPSKVNLTAPENDSYILSMPLVFSWTNSTDDDAISHTEYDYWDIEYLLIIDDDDRFFSPAYQITTNSTIHQMDYPILSDGRYYWKVIATDGDASSASDVFTFLFDANIPQLNMTVYPNPAEYLYRTATVTWSAFDMYLADAYVNVSFPNGTLLGTVDYSPFALTPVSLTVTGNYLLKLYAIDQANNTNVLEMILSVINDTFPPEILLLSPEDKYKSTSSTIIFSYTYNDYAVLKNCTLYYQRIRQYLDIFGNVLYEEDIDPFVAMQVDTTIEPGTNYFIASDLVESAYRWNVFCSDVAGNTAFAEKNRTFSVSRAYETIEYKPKLATFESSERVVQALSGYNLLVKLPVVQTAPGKILQLNFTIENIGNNQINNLKFASTLPWIEINAQIASLPVGQKLEVPFTIRVPYQLGDVLYHVIAISPEINVITPGYITIGGRLDEPPIYVIKRIEPKEGYYNISISIMNSLNRDARLYVEDYITGMREIAFDENNFYVNTIPPPAMILNMSVIKANEIRIFSYTASDLDIEEVQKPFVITDENVYVELQIVNTPKTSIAFFSKFSLEYLFFILFAVFVILGYLNYSKKKRNEKPF
jgi:hypothetical protein